MSDIAMFPIACVSRAASHVGAGRAQRIELDDSFGGHAEPVQVALEVVADAICRHPCWHVGSSSTERSAAVRARPSRIRQRIELDRVLVLVETRQARPRQRVRWLRVERPFERRSEQDACSSRRIVWRYAK